MSLFKWSIFEIRNSRKMNSASLKALSRWCSVRLAMSGMSLCVLVVLGLPGCNKADVEPAETDDTPDQTIVISLETTFEGLLPDEFEINVPRDLPTSDINEWGEQMLSDMVDQDVDEKKLAESLSKLLPGEVVDRILRPRFVLRDSNHVRDSLWARELTQTVIANSKSETDRIVDIFYFVVNTIQVIPAKHSLPFGPFESTQYGQGTAEDRAWTFATMLKQQRIPSVVFVRMSDAESGAPDVTDDEAAVERPHNLIVGALLNDSLYLFDAALGLPVSGPGDLGTAAFSRKPATLTQVLADPTLLSRMSSGDDSPYGVTVESLKNSQPLVIGDSSLWSRRMEGLQNGMPAETPASIFEPLVSHGVFEGVIELVSECISKDLPDAKVGVWLYPEQQREAREVVSRDEEQSRVLAALNDTFKVPEPVLVAVVPDENNPGRQKLNLTFGPSWGVHRNGRVDQILGRPEKAIPAYLKVQDWRMRPPSPKDSPAVAPEVELMIIQQLPQDVKDRHLRAAEEALIWRATCQIQKASYESAAADLEGYLRQLQLATGIYPGRFKNEANYLVGIALAMSGNSRRGMAFLRNVESDNSRYDASRWLIQRWSAQAEKAQ